MQGKRKPKGFEIILMVGLTCKKIFSHRVTFSSFPFMCQNKYHKNKKRTRQFIFSHHVWPGFTLYGTWYYHVNYSSFPLLAQSYFLLLFCLFYWFMKEKIIHSLNKRVWKTHVLMWMKMDLTIEHKILRKIHFRFLHAVEWQVRTSPIK